MADLGAHAGKRDAAAASLIYDGHCPVCSSYVRYLRLRDAVGELRLVNARDGGPLVEDVATRGLDLDAGMVLLYGDRYYHGSDCIHMLALLSSPSGWFNRINARLFRSAAFSRAAYPVLRGGRNLLLRALGRSKFQPVR